MWNTNSNLNPWLSLSLILLVLFCISNMGLGRESGQTLLSPDLQYQRYQEGGQIQGTRVDSEISSEDLEDVISSNVITETEALTEADIEAARLADADTTIYDINQGDFRTADNTDANMSRSEVNTIANGPIYNALEASNMYFTGEEVDGIGNYTVDGAARFQGGEEPRRLDPRFPPRRPRDGIRPRPSVFARPPPARIGPIIEANTWNLRDYRPRSNDRAFRIMRAGLQRLDVLQRLDWLGRPMFFLRLRGFLPTGCHQLRILPVRLDRFNNIRIVVYSIVDPLLVCTQAVRQFEVNIALVRLRPGRYNIVVNNRPITGIIQV